MQPAPIPQDEAARLAVVQSFSILDTPTEERFDTITREAVAKLHVPISTITIMDRDREWFKSCVGTGSREASRAASFCGYAMFAQDIFVVQDTLKDPRFADNPQVTATPGIRFYAGVSLRDGKTHQPIGAFCVKDYHPQELSLEEMDILLKLAKRAEKELNTR